MEKIKIEKWNIPFEGKIRASKRPYEKIKMNF